MLTLLAQDYGCTELISSFPVVQEIENETEREIQTNFSGLIGIYTLTETAAIRARQFLRKLLPNARVEINSDLASTDRLKHLASNADIFVFAWKSSKHQAYYAAKDARGDRSTLLPLGKGSASILECVLAELAQIQMH
jgi:S-adenosylhomocysteine hydrolase